MITHCSPNQAPNVQKTENSQSPRPLPQVPLLSPKPVRAKPTLPPKLSDADIITYLNEGKQTNPVSPSFLSTFYSKEATSALHTTVNEDIYRTETSSYGLSPLKSPERTHYEEGYFGGIPLSVDTSPFEVVELSSTSRRKELPSPPAQRSRRHGNSYEYTSTSPNRDPNGLLSEEEVDTEISDITAFSRVQSIQLQQQNTLDAKSCRSNDRYHVTDPMTDPSKSNYGPLGKSRLTKPLPKPRAVSGALESNQSELKRVYFQVSSLQTQLDSQQSELMRLKKEINEYETAQSNLTQGIQTMAHNEAELKRELLDMNEEMRLMRIENEKLNQENEKYSVEAQRRAETLNRQVGYLKVELIKSATFADSAINQISMGITNVNQVVEYLNSLGKIGPQDQ